MTIRSSSLAASIAIAIALVAASSHAQTTTSPADAARALYVEGKDLRRSGDLARSLEKLEAAHALYATPITALEAGRGHALLGHLKKAIALWESIPSLPVKSTESAKAAEARAEAATLIAQTRERLSKLRVEVVPKEARVLVDGDEVDPAGREAWFVDPGAHHVVAELGDKRSTEEVRVGEGEARTVTLALDRTSDAPPPAAPIPPAPTATKTEPVPPPAPEPATNATSPLVYAGFVVGGVGLATGTVTGVMTLSRASTLKDRCTGGTCPPDANLQTAQTLGTVSTVAFVIGGVGLAVGVGALLFDRGSPSPPSRATLRVWPWVGANGGGIGAELR